MDDPIVIRLPMSVESVPFIKSVVRGVLMSFLTNADRLDVIRDICCKCGSVYRTCDCGVVKDG